MQITAYQLAERFVGVKELPGDAVNSPFVMAMLTLDASWPKTDEVPWCSAFVNFVCWQLRLPRSKSLAARSWLDVGRTIQLADAKPAFDVVVLKRGDNPDQGHVGFFSGQAHTDGFFSVLGGNQGDAVNTRTFAVENVLGVRRLYEDG